MHERTVCPSIFVEWRVVRDVLHHEQRQVHSDSQCQTLASGFSQFFYRQTSTHPSVHRRKFAAVQWANLQPSPAHRTDAVLACSHVRRGGTEAADIEDPQAIPG